MNEVKLRIIKKIDVFVQYAQSSILIKPVCPLGLLFSLTLPAFAITPVCDRLYNDNDSPMHCVTLSNSKHRNIRFLPIEQNIIMIIM